jgi:hypothetical protein
MTIIYTRRPEHGLELQAIYDQKMIENLLEQNGTSKLYGTQPELLYSKRV